MLSARAALTCLDSTDIGSNVKCHYDKKHLAARIGIASVASLQSALYTAGQLCTESSLIPGKEPHHVNALSQQPAG